MLIASQLERLAQAPERKCRQAVLVDDRQCHVDDPPPRQLAKLLAVATLPTGVRRERGAAATSAVAESSSMVSDNRSSLQSYAVSI
jgi:hypothetical protein